MRGVDWTGLDWTGLALWSSEAIAKAITNSAEFAGALKSLIFEQCFLSALRDEQVRGEKSASGSKVRKLRLYTPDTGEIGLNTRDSLLDFHHDGIVFLET
jgi:hypothetical protein